MSLSTPDFDELMQELQSESQILIDWFQDNSIQANPDKFQAIAVGKRTFGKNLVLKISDSEIKCEVVKLLAVDIDCQLDLISILVLYAERQVSR